MLHLITYLLRVKQSLVQIITILYHLQYLLKLTPSDCFVFPKQKGTYNSYTHKGAHFERVDDTISFLKSLKEFLQHFNARSRTNKRVKANGK